MRKQEKAVQGEFRKRFDGDPLLVRSPGRVNLIGGHTDYNDGFVLPAAIGKSITIAIAPNGGNQINLVARDMYESYSHDLSKPVRKSDKGWPDYILGVILQLQQAGYELHGFDCVFGGDIPIGAGLSSSAALEGGMLYGISAIFDLGLSRKEMALMGQKVENEFVGIRSGIMDQFINLHGKEDHALKLDCRSLDFELYPFRQDDIDIVICDTKVRRELAASEYNVRRRQCEQGVELLSQYDDSIRSLRDVSPSLLEDHLDEMEPVIYNRCSYILAENRRVQEACDDLSEGDLGSFGLKMFASHDGLRDLYEVSCEELDILIDEARRIDGVPGARMMGGGFGGCTINLVKKSAFDSFYQTIRPRYRKRTGKTIDLYRTRIAGGTAVIDGGGKESVNS